MPTENARFTFRKPTQFFTVSTETDSQSGASSVSLTTRERQVVALVTEAKLNKEIADRLSLREGTIKEYLNRIFRKTGVKNRTELAIWAIRNPSLTAEYARD